MEASLLEYSRVQSTTKKRLRQKRNVWIQEQAKTSKNLNQQLWYIKPFTFCISFRTLLMKAAQEDRTDIVEYAIKMNASVNFRDTRGWSPILYACKYGNVKSFEILMEHGADVSEETYDDE